MPTLDATRAPYVVDNLLTIINGEHWVPTREKIIEKFVLDDVVWPLIVGSSHEEFLERPAW